MDQDEAQETKNQMLFLAAQLGDIATMRSLLSGANPADLHAHNDAALHATIISNQPAAAQLLIEAGAAVRAERFKGDPLQRAAILGRTEIALMLLEAGADPTDNMRGAWEAAKRNTRRPEILEAMEEADRLKANGFRVQFRHAVKSDGAVMAPDSSEIVACQMPPKPPR